MSTDSVSNRPSISATDVNISLFTPWLMKNVAANRTGRMTFQFNMKCFILITALLSFWNGIEKCRRILWKKNCNCKDNYKVSTLPFRNKIIIAFVMKEVCDFNLVTFRASQHTSWVQRQYVTPRQVPVNTDNSREFIGVTIMFVIKIQPDLVVTHYCSTTGIIVERTMTT